jgi:HPr kinase/phosphorylase
MGRSVSAVAKTYSVSLEKVIRENALETLYTPTDPKDLFVTSKDINRPGLLLAGHDAFFDPKRIQFLGLAEFGYLNSLTADERTESLRRFFETKPVCTIVTRGLEPTAEMLPLAKTYEVPVLRTNESTSAASAALIAYLGVELAERITRHGVLVEVYGEGILIVGDSGVGKSETALELINRGHRLIADDAVEIRKVSSKSLVGSAPENIRHFIELRGVGIINARNLFGIGAVKLTEKINMIIKLEQWNENRVYDRLGLEDDYMSVLGINIPVTTVPVKPGRNLAIIIETAAKNNRQKRMGYSAAKELMMSLGMGPEEIEEPEINIIEEWL